MFCPEHQRVPDFVSNDLLGLLADSTVFIIYQYMKGCSDGEQSLYLFGDDCGPGSRS
jgi:hypothetical protein